jgi:23S rRNA (adenine2503-C2)-methyltransferase
LVEKLAATGQPRFRAAQILQWVYGRRAKSFDQMSDLPKSLRTWLTDNAVLHTSTLTRESVSQDGTRKLLLTQPDGGVAETVWIPSDDRNTACISSQVGCPVGCRFCASGIDGLQRNLTAGEIVEQALRISNLILAESGVTANFDKAAPHQRLTNIVLMGMGEPLANYKAVLRAIRVLNADWGLGIGARRITLSTVGLPRQIRQLAHEGLQLNLALSLHAPFDRLREELIPWAKGISIAELVDACREYFSQTGREITLEYVMLRDVNIGPEHADALAAIARRMRANVNLLRYNPVPDLPFARPDGDEGFAFQERLRHLGVNAHIRRSRGTDVNAACGQLRRSQT